MFDIVTMHANQRPRDVALVVGERRITWREFEERIRHAACGLRAAGLARGDSFAVVDRNHPAIIETAFAAALTGMIAVFVNWRSTPEDIARTLVDSRSKLVFVGAEFEDVIEDVRGGLDDVIGVITIGPTRRTNEDEYEVWLEAHETSESMYESAHARSTPEDCFLQLYTSGTTAHPKGVMLTHRGVCANAAAIAQTVDMGADSVNLVAMPLFHFSGASWALLGLYVGARTVLLRDMTPRHILAEVENHQATHTFLVSAMLSLLLREPDLAGRDLTSLRVLAYGGGPIPRRVLHRSLHRLRGQRLMQLYGMTELAGAVSLLGHDEHRDPRRTHLLSSAGRPVSGVEVRVVDPVTSEDVPIGFAGEFWVRGQQSMAGYWNRPEANARTLAADGWLRTGDFGHMDADGYLYVSHHVNDLIMRGGERISPTEVERVLADHHDVSEAAVIGVPDEEHGQAVKAFVIPSAGRSVTELDAEALISHARQRLAYYKCPTSVDVVEVLPRSQTGGVLRRALRAPYWSAPRARRPFG